MPHTRFSLHLAIAYTLLGILVAAGSITAAWHMPEYWTIGVAIMATAFAGLIGLTLVQAARSSETMTAINGENLALRESIRGMPHAFSVFDSSDRLIAWNKHYESLYGDAFGKAASKADENGIIHYAELLRATAPETVEAGALQTHIKERIAMQRQADGSSHERKYPDVGWQRVTKYKTPSGAVASVGISIQDIKQKDAEIYKEKQLRQAFEVKLHTLANIDPLTGLMSRPAFISKVGSEVERSCRYDNSMCALIVDIDQFKPLNDGYGDLVGDQLLAMVANCIQETVREDVDVVGRIGGEEFGVLLPQIDAQGGQYCADRIREAVSKARLKTTDGDTLRLTVCVGVSSIDDRDVNADIMLDEAHRAVDYARANGGNVVALYTSDFDELDGVTEFTLSANQFSDFQLLDPETQMVIDDEANFHTAKQGKVVGVPADSDQAKPDEARPEPESLS